MSRRDESGPRAVVARDLAQAAAWRQTAAAVARVAGTPWRGWTSVRQAAYGEAIAAAREWLASARSVRLEHEPRPACSGCPDGCRECEELNMRESDWQHGAGAAHGCDDCVRAYGPHGACRCGGGR